jgi:hypothetical protein
MNDLRPRSLLYDAAAFRMRNWTSAQAPAGGSIEDPRLAGAVLPGGGDWMVVEADGTARLDVRITLAPDTSGLVLCTNTGRRHGAAHVLAALGRGEVVDPAADDMRVLMRFEADPERAAGLAEQGGGGRHWEQVAGGAAT